MIPSKTPEQQEEQLLKEVSDGANHGRVFEEYVEPFFELKNSQIFEAWKSTESKDEKQLMLLKLQANVLEGMKEHFIYFMETGQLAAVTLNQREEEK